jgi:hypothetical protein
MHSMKQAAFTINSNSKTKHMRKRNYNKPQSIYSVSNRTIRLESNYKGWNQPAKKLPAPAKFKSRWESRANPKKEEEEE